MILDRPYLDSLYERWNRPEYISPDPLETLTDYGNSGDREAAALTAACMAYGRVSALLPPLRRVLGVMGRHPRLYVTGRSEGDMARDLNGVVHRFARPAHLAALLAGAGAVIRRYGGLEAVFLEGFRGSGGDVGGGLETLGSALRSGARGEAGHLLADASRGSACKRLLLFLRWMVRRDAVDPGGWNTVSPRHLLPPLDTWTHRIALRAGWTHRRTPDMKTVREVSAALRRINPEDPVKYDFALSRYGIRSELSLESLFSRPGLGYADDSA